MALVKHIEMIGNQFKLYYDDGTHALAVPTQGTHWLVTGASGTVDPPEPVFSNYAWPFGPSHISDVFGLREDVGRWHEGTDFAGGPASTGQPIPAIASGNVILAGWYGNFGNSVIIDHGVLDSGKWQGSSVQSVYAHMSTDPVVSVGASVAGGQTLGPIGNSGASFGAHLHLELHIIPPGRSRTNDYLDPRPAPPSNRTAVDFEEFMALYNPANTVIYP